MKKLFNKWRVLRMQKLGNIEILFKKPNKENAKLLHKMLINFQFEATRESVNVSQTQAFNEITQTIFINDIIVGFYIKKFCFEFELRPNILKNKECDVLHALYILPSWRNIIVKDNKTIAYHVVQKIINCASRSFFTKATTKSSIMLFKKFVANKKIIEEEFNLFVFKSNKK